MFNVVARKFKILCVALVIFLLDKAGLGIQSSYLLGGAKPVNVSRVGVGRKSCPGKPKNLETRTTPGLLCPPPALASSAV